MELMPVVNTREDLDLLQKTDETAYKKFMDYLKGSMVRMQDVAVYPEGYNQMDYDGDKIDQVWQEVEDLTTIERFGFSKADFA